MNRRDALKSLAAVAAGGSLPAAGAVVMPKVVEQISGTVISGPIAAKWLALMERAAKHKRVAFEEIADFYLGQSQ